MGPRQHPGRSAELAPIPSGQTAILDTDGNYITLARSIAGPGGLTKLGDGTLALSVADTYSGTTLDAGTLSFADAARWGAVRSRLVAARAAMGRR